MENNLSVWSVPVLMTYWNELIYRFEKSESNELLKALDLVEKELNKRGV